MGLARRDPAVRNRMGLRVCGLYGWWNPDVGGKFMNFPTIVVLIMIGAALCAAVFSMIRSRRKGRGWGCSSCSRRFRGTEPTASGESENSERSNRSVSEKRT